MKDNQKRLVLGSMTGTSCDGLDLALLEIDGIGTNLRPRFIQGQSFELGDLGPRLRRFAEGEKLSAAEICALNRDFSERHVTAVHEFKAGDVHLFSVHGQTLFHSPPLSWQMVDLGWIAARLNCLVIGDLRGVDLALGGQGAPISPLADAYFYGSPLESRYVINLGGFCNITWLPAQADIAQIAGFDLCAVNQWLDFLARELLGQAYDDQGKVALSGQVNSALATNWTQRLKAQFSEGQSLGQSELPNASWLVSDVSVADQLASACEAIADCICSALHERVCDRILVAGGGWHNLALRRAMQRQLKQPIETCEAYGPPSAFREAAALALLGILAVDGVPITLPQITGCSQKFVSGLQINPNVRSY